MLWRDCTCNASYTQLIRDSMLQVGTASTIAPQLWPLLTTGSVVQPPHSMSSRVVLPFPALLETLGLQLTLRSTKGSKGSTRSIKQSGDRNGLSMNGDSSNRNGGSSNGMRRQRSHSSSNSSIEEGAGELHKHIRRQVLQPGSASGDSRKSGPNSSKTKGDDKHRCWQPVVSAYGPASRMAEGGGPNAGDVWTPGSAEHMDAGARGTEQSAGAREVIRTDPAELSLWAVEAAGKGVGVLSDPSCELHLK